VIGVEWGSVVRRRGAPKRRSVIFRNPSGAPRFIIEPIEPRQLLSGTALNAVQAQNAVEALHDNLLHFEAVLAAMEHTGKFADTLPMIAGQTASGEASLGSIVKLSSLIDADVVTPLTAYVKQIAAGTGVPQDTEALAAGIQSVIQSTLGTNGQTVSVTDASSNSGKIDLEFSFNLKTTNSFSMTIGDKANVDMTFPSDIQGSAAIKVSNLNFETVFDTTSKVLTDATVKETGSKDLLDNFTFENFSAGIHLGVSATIPNGQEIDVGLLTLETTGTSQLSYGGDFSVGFTAPLTGTQLTDDAGAGAAGDFSFLDSLAETTIAVDPLVSLAIPVKL
jgi:hypothetical protein